jgi:signal transduction histidine kinase
MHTAEGTLDDQDRGWLALIEGLAALHETLDPQRVLETALEVIPATLSGGAQTEQLVQAVMIFSEAPGEAGELRVHAMRGLTYADSRIALPGISGLIGQVLKERRPRLSRTPRKDSELRRIESLGAAGEVYCLPLGKASPEGILLCAHPERGFFTAKRRQSLERLTSQVSLALFNARRLREYQAQIDRLLDLHEMNRQRLARELHDGPTQSVAALAMRVNIARRLVARESPNLAEELEKIEAIARQATGELRQLLFQIHPQVLESQGLAPAMQALAEKYSQAHGKTVRVQVEPEAITALEMSRQAAIFDLIDQVLRAACRKEEVESIQVRLLSDGIGQAVLEIEDDGLVVRPSAAQLWVEAIRNQVSLLGGELQVITLGAHGSCLRTVIPPGNEAAERTPVAP